MFLIHVTYKKSFDIVDKLLSDHRKFLERGYQENYFIVSGPRNPRTGGIILSQLKQREKLIEILQQDPFAVHDVADYEIIEFLPVKYHKDFEKFI